MAPKCALEINIKVPMPYLTSVHSPTTVADAGFYNPN